VERRLLSSLIGRSSAEDPSLGLFDLEVVDARFVASHQSLLGEFPELVVVAAPPLAIVIVAFVFWDCASMLLAAGARDAARSTTWFSDRPFCLYAVRPRGNRSWGLWSVRALRRMVGAEADGARVSDVWIGGAGVPGGERGRACYCVRAGASASLASSGGFGARVSWGAVCGDRDPGRRGWLCDVHRIRDDGQAVGRDRRVAASAWSAWGDAGASGAAPDGGYLAA
jgi:hypothetical protein